VVIPKAKKDHYHKKRKITIIEICFVRNLPEIFSCDLRYFIFAPPHVFINAALEHVADLGCSSHAHMAAGQILPCRT